MASQLACPNCEKTGLDVHDYESLIVLTADFALFTVRCPGCGSRVTSVQPIPRDLREEVQFAAIEVGAGMGREA